MSEMLGFHEGERMVQRRAGVEDEARRVQRIYRDTIPHAAAEFLAEQRLVVTASADSAGRVWASLLAGPPGSFQATDQRTVRLGVPPLRGDPLVEAVTRGDRIGLLVFEPATRRRMRLNGVASMEPGGSIELRAEQVYGNCTRYIRPRLPTWDEPSTGDSSPASGGSVRSDRLTPGHRDLVGKTDTLFIATRHPQHGADASHRGGAPGFVRLDRTEAGRDLLLLPDYPGNNMFNTLGNLAVDPAVGLLFLDFEGRDVLMLSGIARVQWEPEMVKAFRGAERVIEVEVQDVLALQRPAHQLWRPAESSEPRR